MQLYRDHEKTVVLHLAKDIIRDIKRGHPWVFANALKDLPKAPIGSSAILKAKKDEIIASGFYDHSSQLAFRVCRIGQQKFDAAWITQQFKKAIELRKNLLPQSSTGFRLLNGEGDQLPGLVCDIYGKSAVLQLDGAGPVGFWNLENIAKEIQKEFALEQVVYKARSDLDEEPRALIGTLHQPVTFFLENNIRFAVDIAKGQKTGFFLDQRDNREFVKSLSQGKTVLNLFGYTGGFSVYAGSGGATHVTTVDIAHPAVQFAEKNWELNQLPKERHEAVQANVFDFIEKSAKDKRKWDVVICDPPSFAPNNKSLEKAKLSYPSLFAQSIGLVQKSGFFVASSCSSHISEKLFLEICEEALSKSRRVGQIIKINNQSIDHPFPMVCQELRYLKFVVMRLD